jgi:histidine triad (HIT) family protein
MSAGGHSSEVSVGSVCAFCDIANGDTPAHIVYEDPQTIAFLDHRPLFVGHSLVIPRAHIETLADLPPESIERFFKSVQLLASVIPDALDAHGTFVAINNRVSQSVPHLHAHVVPRRFKDGLRGFFWPRRKYRDEAEMKAAAEAIRASITEMQ